MIIGIYRKIVTTLSLIIFLASGLSPAVASLHGNPNNLASLNHVADKIDTETTLKVANVLIAATSKNVPGLKQRLRSKRFAPAQIPPEKPSVVHNHTPITEPSRNHLSFHFPMHGKLALICLRTIVLLN